MKLDRIGGGETTFASSRAIAALILATCLGAYFFYLPRPLIPDVAWLLEASRRWLAGAKLYRDIIDVQPPLVFYEMAALTAGHVTASSYIAGVCAVMAASALWALRLRGAYVGLAAMAAMLFGGLTDFGQRDHLALIFVIPLLLGEKASRGERYALGLWAFLGVGLKPYFLLIPAFAAVARAVSDRSLRPLFAPEYLALGAICALYVMWAAIIHPDYFGEMVPLGQFVYWAYGAPVQPALTGLSIAVVITSLIPLIIRDRDMIPVAAATLGGVASFYVQGRNWSYHFVPAIGLGILLAMWSARRHRGISVLAVTLIAGQVFRGPHHWRAPRVIPDGVESVAFLSAHVFTTYPESTEKGVRIATRYPALWVLPGAWNILHDPSRSKADQQKAAAILGRERTIIRGDLLTQRPQLIFVDARPQKPYYQTQFDYIQFLGPLPGYRKIGHVWVYDVWGRE